MKTLIIALIITLLLAFSAQVCDFNKPDLVVPEKKEEPKTKKDFFKPKKKSEPKAPNNFTTFWCKTDLTNKNSVLYYYYDV